MIEIKGTITAKEQQITINKYCRTASGNIKSKLQKTHEIRSEMHV